MKADFKEMIGKLKEKYSDAEVFEEPAMQTLAESKIAMFPERYKDASFEAYKFYGKPEYQHIQHRLIDLLKAGNSVVMYGKNGTGKTMLAFASIRDKILKGQSTCYASLIDIIDEVKDSFGNRTPTGRIVEKYVGYDYLVIDEMDKSYGTATEFLNIFRIVNGRYLENKPTVMITNATQDDVIEIVGRSSYERIVEDGTAVNMSWESFRKSGGKE